MKLPSMPAALHQLQQRCAARWQAWAGARRQQRQRQAVIALAAERASQRQIVFADTQIDVYRSEAFAEDLLEQRCNAPTAQQARQLLAGLRRSSAGIMRAAAEAPHPVKRSERAHP
ncbi:hypothetical protein RQP53_15475 [Paucibacter sp. APW11]|uniref:Uncharacterized protein n=1 Tax=Roseateles aquae TaxID=3077235 RepID=A0ABU3PDL5_9BURK|nr:hypothetical protein [Paucibacter sp. APW11]MDT9000675.1 hypothetical protein [Paucibacter sp. APW11]